jgi:hypothetical protein
MECQGEHSQGNRWIARLYAFINSRKPARPIALLAKPKAGIPSRLVNKLLAKEVPHKLKNKPAHRGPASIAPL